MEKRILIIEDHPTQIDGYRAVLSLSSRKLSFTTATTIEQAHTILIDPETPGFDLVMLDWSLPEYPKAKLFNGGDLGILIRHLMPEAKIMMLTSHFKLFLLFNLTSTLKPEGLLVKSDFAGAGLIEAFETIMDGGIYYTESVLESLREVGSQTEDLDTINRQIIELLAQGVKTKTLTEHLHLSQSSIEKRKAHIKDYMGLYRASDEAVVMEARRKGYI
jgi:two-component system, NarL family, response regulator NreC